MEWIEIAYAVIIVHTILRNIEGYSYVENHRYLEKRMVFRNSVIRDHYMFQNMKPHIIYSKKKRFIHLKFVSTNEKSLNKQPEFSDVSIIKNSLKLSENKKHLFHINHTNNFVLSHEIPSQQSLFTRKSELNRKVLNSTILKIYNVKVKTCSENNQNCLQLRKYARLKDHLRTNISPDCKTLNINDCEKFNTKLTILHITNREIDIPATSIRLKRNIEENRVTPLYFSSIMHTEKFKLVPREKHNNSYLSQYKSSGQHTPLFNVTTGTSLSVSDKLQNLASELTHLNKTLLFILSQALEKSRIHNDTKISKETTFPEIKINKSLATENTSALNNLKNSTQALNDLTQNSAILYNYTDIKDFKRVSVTSTVSSLKESNTDSALKSSYKDFISAVKNIRHSVDDYERNYSDLCQKSSGVTLSTTYSNFANHNLTSFNNIKMNTSQNNYNASNSFKELFSEAGYEYSSDVPSEEFGEKNVNRPTSEKNYEYSVLFHTEKCHINNRTTQSTSNPPSETPESYTTEIFTWTQHSKSASEEEQIISTPVSGWNFTLENVSLSDVIENFKRMYPVTLWESGGFFTESFLLSINPHWLQFSPPPPLNHYILAALYCVVMTVGMVGNVLVIFMFVRCRTLQTPANFLVMNLAVSDLLLMSKMPIFVYNSLYCGPMLGEIGCQIYGFIGGLTGTVSITTLAVIALDRYYVIVSPIRKTTRCRARLSVAFAWCYGIIFSLLPLLGVGIGSYVPEGYLTSCSFNYLDFSFNNRLFIFIFFLAAWLIPFCIITVCYIGICRVVVLTRNVKHIFGKDSSRHEKKRSEIRLAGVIIGIIGLWFAAWTPYAVVALLGITGKKEYITPLSSMIPALFCKTASCLDPYFYAVTHPKFRQEVTSLVRKINSKSKFRMERNRSSRAWSIQYEMSETCRYQVSQRCRQNSEDLSDIEENVVVLESKCKNKGPVSSSDENTLGVRNIDEGVFKENDSAADTSQRQKQIFPISKAESGL